MPSVFVDVEPVVLDWVMRYISDVKNDDIINYLIKWKNGEKKPTFNQIESVSKATRIPLGYFFLKSPPIEVFPILQYRTIDSIGTTELSRDMVDTLNHMESIQSWMRDYMIDVGNEKLSFVGFCSAENDMRLIVRNFRNALQIPIDWHTQLTSRIDAFKFFREKLEDIGVLTMTSGIVGSNTHRSLSIDDFRAFTLIDDYAPLIFINANDSTGAKLFSLLHEAVHIFLGISNLYNDRYGNADGVSAVETLCNTVTAEVLVPNNLFCNEWRNCAVQDISKKVTSLSASFKCGVVVIARKALDNKFINKDQYKVIADEAVTQFYSSRGKSKGGDYYLTTATRIDNRFLIALDNFVREGKTQYTDAFRLTHTNRKTYSGLMDEVRGSA